MLRFVVFSHNNSDSDRIARRSSLSCSCKGIDWPKGSEYFFTCSSSQESIRFKTPIQWNKSLLGHFQLLKASFEKRRQSSSLSRESIHACKDGGFKRVKNEKKLPEEMIVLRILKSSFLLVKQVCGSCFALASGPQEKISLSLSLSPDLTL
jgi:hypothetical protein